MISDSQNPAKAATRKQIILTVDDDPNNLAVVRDCLLELDYTILVAEDGESAVQRAAYAQPDLILLDIMMPGIDGYETCRRLKAMESTKEIPVIFMTALAETVHKVKGLETGAVDYITKPFQREELLARIAVHLHNRELTKRLKEANHALAEEIRQSQQTRKDIEALNIDLKHHSEALESANRELESFSYSVSHDLRAPLRHMAGFSTILLESYGDKLDSDAITCIIRIGNAVNKMEHLIDSLLELSRISQTGLMRQWVDLSSIAAEIVAELQETSPQRNVRVEIAAGLGAMADLNLMRAVLHNLLGNAWKYTEKVPSATVSFFSTEKGGQAIYCVRDNGVGFDMAYSDKLFGAFQRLHGNEYEGSGIGLATVQRIIQRHGGTIWFESEPGKGASFYFTLDCKEVP